jgi:hypothetical protein
MCHGQQLVDRDELDVASYEPCDHDCIPKMEVSQLFAHKIKWTSGHGKMFSGKYKDFRAPK